MEAKGGLFIMEKNLSESVKDFLEKRQLKSVKAFYDTEEWRQLLTRLKRKNQRGDSCLIPLHGEP